jgi:hypothetical protein
MDTPLNNDIVYKYNLFPTKWPLKCRKRGAHPDDYKFFDSPIQSEFIVSKEPWYHSLLFRTSFKTAKEGRLFSATFILDTMARLPSLLVPSKQISTRREFQGFPWRRFTLRFEKAAGEGTIPNYYKIFVRPDKVFTATGTTAFAGNKPFNVIGLPLLWELCFQIRRGGPSGRYMEFAENSTPYWCIGKNLWWGDALLLWRRLSTAEEQYCTILILCTFGVRGGNRYRKFKVRFSRVVGSFKTQYQSCA